MPHEQILANARMVTRNEVIHGALLLRDGLISGLAAGNTDTASTDCDGDFLIPGLVELHTDNLEKHYAPRSGVEWDPVSAAMSHDVQIAGSGITTVFDSVVLGAAPGWDMRDSWLAPILSGLERARDLGLLKADHRLHFRCEVTHGQIGQILEQMLGQPGLGLLSLMDHAPGDRQSPDVEAYKKRYRTSFGMSDEAVEAHVRALVDGSRLYGPGNRRQIAGMAAARGLALASHDDASATHIAEAKALGCALSEFPTTLDAARASHEHGLMNLVGAPNLVRGTSHSGNVQAAALAQAGLLDIISSDYLPAALLPAAVKLTGPGFDMSLPDAIATVTATPAQAVGLPDRGRIAVGLRADLVRVRMVEGWPQIRAVWVQGERVA